MDPENTSLNGFNTCKLNAQTPGDKLVQNLVRTPDLENGLNTCNYVRATNQKNWKQHSHDENKLLKVFS